MGCIVKAFREPAAASDCDHWVGLGARTAHCNALVHGKHRDFGSWCCHLSFTFATDPSLPI